MKAGEQNKLYLETILKRLFGDNNVVMEHKFHPTRKWRFDYAIPDAKLAFEYQGHSGLTTGKASGHSSVIGLTNDCEKFNQARAHGWTVICFTAFYFQYRDRIRHKLTDPESTIMQVIAQMQDEKESQQKK
jgi:hypothetical protein